MVKKLYRVTIKESGDEHIHYVLAEDAGQAYVRVRTFLDAKDWCSNRERVMDEIELLAEAADYPECGVRLYL